MQQCLYFILPSCTSILLSYIVLSCLYNKKLLMRANMMWHEIIVSIIFSILSKIFKLSWSWTDWNEICSSHHGCLAPTSLLADFTERSKSRNLSQEFDFFSCHSANHFSIESFFSSPMPYPCSCILSVNVCLIFSFKIVLEKSVFHLTFKESCIGS